MSNAIHHIDKAEERNCVHFIEAFDGIYLRFSFVEVKFPFSQVDRSLKNFKDLKPEGLP